MSKSRMHEQKSSQSAFRQRHVYQMITTRTVIPDEAMISNLSNYQIALKSGKCVDAYLRKLGFELQALESIEPLMRTEIVDKLFAQFADSSAEGKQSILSAFAAIVKTPYKHVLATDSVERLLKILSHFTDAENLKTVLEILRELIEIDEDVAESVLRCGGIDIILHASEFSDEDVLERCSLVILFVALFGGKNSVNILMKNDMNKRMVKFLLIFDEKRINFRAYFALIYLKIIHRVSNEFFEFGFMDNVANWLSENEICLREKAAIECNDKTKLRKKLLPLLTSKSRMAQTIGTFQICCEISRNMMAQKTFEDAALVRALKRIAVYSNEFTSTLATNALIVLTSVNDSRFKRFPTQPMSEWRCEDIQRWLKVFGFEEYAIFFRGVDGETFTRLKDRELRTGYFMVDSGMRKSFFEERSHVCEETSHRMIEYKREIERNSLLGMIENGAGKVIKSEDITAAIEAPFTPIRKKIDVFISYRRMGGSDLASLISYHLRSKNFRVFLDVVSLGSGRFADELKLSIQKSANFLLLLTTDALKRCNEENDWIRIEIEMAMKSRCNIIPITRDFDNSVFEGDVLPSEIRKLSEYNQITWHHDTQNACLAKIEEYLQPRDTGCIQMLSLKNFRALNRC